MSNKKQSPVDFVIDELYPAIALQSKYIEEVREQGKAAEAVQDKRIADLKEWIKNIVNRESMYSIKNGSRILTPEEIRKAKQLLQ